MEVQNVTCTVKDYSNSMMKSFVLLAQVETATLLYVAFQ